MYSMADPIIINQIETVSRPLKSWISLLFCIIDSPDCREVLFSVLGKRLVLPILQPYYVYVDPSFIDMPSFSSLYGTAFASEEEQVPPQRVLQGDALDKIGSWSEIYNCATFDAWIANRDRLPNNILFSGVSGYWLIDHEEALPNGVTSKQAVGTQLAREISGQDRDDLRIRRNRDAMLRFINRALAIDWDEIRLAMRLQEVKEIEDLCNQHIQVLQRRLPNIREIISSDLGIAQ